MAKRNSGHLGFSLKGNVRNTTERGKEALRRKRESFSPSLLKVTPSSFLYHLYTLLYRDSLSKGKGPTRIQITRMSLNAKQKPKAERRKKQNENHDKHMSITEQERCRAAETRNKQKEKKRIKSCGYASALYLF